MIWPRLASRWERSALGAGGAAWRGGLCGLAQVDLAGDGGGDEGGAAFFEEGDAELGFFGDAGYSFCAFSDEFGY